MVQDLTWARCCCSSSFRRDTPPLPPPLSPFVIGKELAEPESHLGKPLLLFFILQGHSHQLLLHGRQLLAEHP